MKAKFFSPDCSIGACARSNICVNVHARMLLGNLRELNEEIMLIEASDRTSKVFPCRLADGCYYINRTNCEAGLGHPLVSVGLLK